jgi:alanine dehydrogenase
LPIYLKEADVVSLIGMTDTIDALTEAFRAQARNAAVNIPRTRWGFAKGRLNVMGGGIGTRYALKAYGGSTYHVMLWESGKGLLAIIEADNLGQLRTGAASAVASRAMARPGAQAVGMIGAGRQARTQAQALHAAGLVRTLSIFARDRANLETFCTELAVELKVPVVAAHSAEEAIAQAGIAIAATSSSTPVIMSDWVTPGTHVNGMGANAAARQELDAALVARADLLVTDDIEQAKVEAGEFIALAKTGQLQWDRVTVLHDIVSAPPTRAANAVTVYKSLGVGLEDAAVASLAYDRAVATGRFRPV